MDQIAFVYLFVSVMVAALFIRAFTDLETKSDRGL